jgi:hypothetical protein
VFCSLVSNIYLHVSIVFLYIYIYVCTHLSMYVCIYMHVHVAGTVFTGSDIVDSLCVLGENCHLHFCWSLWACHTRNFGGVCVSGLYESQRCVCLVCHDQLVNAV